MPLEKAQDAIDAFQERSDSTSHISSVRASTPDGDDPPSLVPQDSEMPTRSPVMPHPIADPDRDGPFDTDSPGWTFGGHLTASLQSVDPSRNRPHSAEMSVLFQNLCVIGAGSGAAYQDSVGEIARTPFKMIQGLFSRRKDPEKTILYGVDGVVRAGEMLLVLGRPGSGCSTLLKNLAGFSEGYVRVEGDIKYNGVDIDIVRHRFRADVVYNAEGLYY